MTDKQNVLQLYPNAFVLEDLHSYSHQPAADQRFIIAYCAEEVPELNITDGMVQVDGLRVWSQNRIQPLSAWSLSPDLAWNSAWTVMKEETLKKLSK